MRGRFRIAHPLRFSARLFASQNGPLTTVRSADSPSPRTRGEETERYRALALAKNSSTRAGVMASVCSVTGTSQYSERGRHSSR